MCKHHFTGLLCTGAYRFYWHHAFLAAFHAELGNCDEATKNIEELLAVYPNFCEKVRDEIDTCCVHDALAKQMIAGWQKAGLDIE